MLKRSHLTAACAVAVGAPLGYAAASGKVSPFGRTDAWPPAESPGRSRGPATKRCSRGALPP